MKGNCLVCGCEIELVICCNGFMCGCAGKPIEPEVCHVCYDEFINNIDKYITQDTQKSSFPF